MLSEYEKQFLKRTLFVFIKLRLAPFRFDAKKGKFESTSKWSTAPITLGLISLHVAHIAFCIWRISHSNKQTQFILIFSIVVNLCSIPFRMTLVKCYSEMADLTNNILCIDNALSKSSRNFSIN